MTHSTEKRQEAGAGIERVRTLLQRHTPSCLAGRRIETASRPETGNNSEVWIVRFDDGSGIVVRVLGSAAEAARLGRWLRTFRARGLPVPGAPGWTGLLPRVLHRGEGVLVEELVPGRLLTDVPFDRAVCTAVVRALAGLHDETRAAAGPPDKPRRRDVHALLLETALKNVQRTKRDALPAGESFDAEKTAALLRAAHAPLRPLDPFSLVHHRIGRSDVMLRPDGGAVLLDCGSLQYGHFGHDLFDVLGMFDRNDAGAFRGDCTEEYYAARRNLPQGHDYATIAPFFELAMHVRRLRSFTTKADAKGDRSESEIARALEGIRQCARDAER